MKMILRKTPADLYNPRMASGVGQQERQAAAIPFRDGAGKIEVLLIRRKDKPWGIPKGDIDIDRTARESALNEAREEAGVRGDLLDEPLGQFIYEKQNRSLLVDVFAMRVTKVDDRFLEEAIRERRWVPLEQALDLIGRREVQPLIAKLGRILKNGSQT
jgi:8-oxo-dGTP pyrophosphatase MutT (NUDIX family)